MYSIYVCMYMCIYKHVYIYIYIIRFYVFVYIELFRVVSQEGIRNRSESAGTGRGTEPNRTRPSHDASEKRRPTASNRDMY